MYRDDNVKMFMVFVNRQKVFSNSSVGLYTFLSSLIQLLTQRSKALQKCTMEWIFLKICWLELFFQEQIEVSIFIVSQYKLKTLMHVVLSIFAKDPDVDWMDKSIKQMHIFTDNPFHYYGDGTYYQHMFRRINHNFHQNSCRKNLM